MSQDTLTAERGQREGTHEPREALVHSSPTYTRWLSKWRLLRFHQTTAGLFSTHPMGHWLHVCLHKIKSYMIHIEVQVSARSGC